MVSRVLGVLLILFYALEVSAQASSLRQKYFTVTPGELVQIDSMTIYPNSLKVFCEGNLLNRQDYDLNLTKGTIQFLRPCSTQITMEYRVFSTNFAEKVQHRDTNLIFKEKKGEREEFLTEAKFKSEDLFGNSSLNKNGSISRGISFGNTQDMAVNSNMNLELSGKLTPNLKVLASISDANIPIQPDGNTNKLQSFDKVFIQIYNDDMSVIAGDFWLKKPKLGYYMNYNKKAQGLYGEYHWLDPKKNKWTVQGGGAFSKGKFNRQNIQGVEGNQGPYRLLGSENEAFIIVLSGTEKVYIDGKILERGQDFDYIIDYNTAEITFTTKNPITKDKRIVVEFQYSDQNYARSLFQASSFYEGKKFNFWFNAYSEQDAKNQSIQQSLSPEQKFFLSNIGDNLQDAYISSIDSVAFSENQNMYRMVDTLGYDSVLVYSVDKNIAHFTATFTQVGDNQGDYILTKYTAMGKVFQWVAPIGGVSQGNYQAKRVIATPKKRQMFNAGASYALSKHFTVLSEFSYTNNDLNTFSKLDASDNAGFGNKSQIIGIFNLSRDSIPKWKLEAKGSFEAISKNYQYIENYRSVEYDRDWNTRGKNYLGNDILSSLQADFRHIKNGHFLVNASQYSIGNSYNGFKGSSIGKWQQSGFNVDYDVSYLTSKSMDIKTQFLRNKTDISQQIKFFKIGIKNEFEQNQFNDSLGIMANSYRFIDYEAYLANADTSQNGYKIYYRERYDQLSDSGRLVPVTKAQNLGGEYRLTQFKNHTLTLLANYRKLTIQDQQLSQNTPENTLLSRIDYQLKLARNSINLGTFYEIGSGLERKQEFQYLKVADGQGVYTWIDYNNDGIKDLNEFEVAQYQDQASYVRIYVLSDQYTHTYTNEFNQTLSINPDRIWRNEKGFKRFVSRFSDQARFRVYHKTSELDKNSFNPFSTRISDTTLVSTNSIIRNSFYFNRTDPIFGMEYTFQDSRNKTLLANGFDARTDTYHEFDFHVNIKRKFTVETTSQYGVKTADADYTSGRNFNYQYLMVKPALSYQPSTAFRLTFETRISDKKNVDNQKAFITEYTLKTKWNQSQKGSFQASFSYIKIEFNGTDNSALAYELLESLKPGNNLTWSVGYQHSISKNLQLSLQYTARKSEGNKIIHNAGMEVRAFF